MDIFQLKTLIHVAEIGSISGAAGRLGITQPALSRQIRLLEEELGVYLFDRNGRGMGITDIGKEVLEHAERILIEIDAIRQTTSSNKTSFRGAVSVGTTPTIAEIITTPLVRAIRTEHPKLGIRFSSAFSGHILDWLQRGELDLAISYEPAAVRSLRVVPVMIEELMLISPASKSQQGPVPFAQLAQTEMVIPSRRHGLRTIIDECARQAGIELSPTVEADSFGAMIDLVRNGFGSTVLPLASVHGPVRAGILNSVQLVDPVPSRKLVLAYPADRPVSAAARFVGDTFLSIAKELVASDVWIGRMLI